MRGGKKTSKAIVSVIKKKQFEPIKIMKKLKEVLPYFKKDVIHFDIKMLNVLFF